MEPVKITAENAADFSDLIDADVKCNIGRSFFKGLGVFHDDGKPAGAMVYELLNYDSESDTRIRIHSFAAADDAAAELLMSGYDNAVSKDGAAESLYETGDERINAIFGSHGFNTERTESPDIVITVGELNKAMAAFMKKLPGYIHDMSGTSPLEYRDFLKKCLINGIYGQLEDLGYLPLSWFEREISSCSVSEEKLDGVLLIRKLPSQVLVPCLFTAFGIDFQKHLWFILCNSAKRVAETYPEETKVLIRRRNTSVKQLTDKLFPGKKGEEVYVGKRTEG